MIDGAVFVERMGRMVGASHVLGLRRCGLTVCIFGWCLEPFRALVIAITTASTAAAAATALAICVGAILQARG